MKIFFVRHGKDDDSYRGGWSNLDLVDEGREQAFQLAAYLYENQKINKINCVISSDLVRTMSTATYIADRLSIPIIQESQIREMNNGDLAGISNKLAEEKYPGLYFNTLEMTERYPNGESPAEFYGRIKNWLFKFMSEYHDKTENILVVTHSGVINIIYYIINNMDWSNKAKPFKVSNCSIHILDSISMKFECENRTCFLNSKREM